MNNQDDLRKSVKNKSRKAKKNYKLPILLIILLLLVIGIVSIVKIKNNKNILSEEVTQYNYFITSINGKSGVIDKEGKIIIESKYDYIQIPNPERPIFVCLEGNDSKVLNEKNKEILTKYKNVQAIPNNNTSIKNPYQTQVLSYKENDKYGLINLKGKKITKPVYESIETLEYKDGILKIKQDGKYGLIDLKGNEIIKPKYNLITTDGYYNEETKYDKAGYIVNVRTDSGYRYGYINYRGKEMLDTMYTDIKRITEKKDDNVIYLVTYKNGKAGILKNGQTIIENEYEDIEYDIENEIIILQKDVKQGVYDFEGNMILPIQYENITFAGQYINAYKDEEFQVFDINGILQNKESHKSIEKVNNGKYSITIDRDNKYGVIDANKNEILENKYSYIEYAFDDYFIITINGKSGVVDGKNNIIIEPKKDIIQNIRGTNIIQIIDSKTNISEIYNNKMEKVSTQNDARIYIKDDYIQIASLNNIEYFDFDGNKKETNEIFKENKIFSKKQDGKWGYVDKDGNIVVDFKYDMATDVNKYGFAAVKNNNKWGVVDKDGIIIKEPIYELDEYVPNFIGEYYEVRSIYEIPYYSNEI